MIYPKIYKKPIVLLLICLVFILFAVGVMMMFFPNAATPVFMPPSLMKIYNDIYRQRQQQKHQINEQEQQQKQQQQQHVQQSYNEHHHQALLQHYDKNNIKKDNSYQPYFNSESRRISKYANINNNNINSKSEKEKIHFHNKFPQSSEEIISSEEENFSGNNKNKNNFYTNSDTIYIDDYDRLNEKIDSNNNNNNNKKNNNEEEDLLDIKGIDYFDTIIMDHNNHKKDSQNLNVKGTTTEANLTEKEKDLLIFTKNLYNHKNKYRKLRNGKIKSDISSNIIISNTNNNEDGADFDNETIGSGSGDFIDDTEIDDEQTVTNKISRKRLKNNRRSSSKRQRYRNYRLENGNENFYSVSSEIVSNLSTNESTLMPVLLSSRSSSLSSLLPSFTSSRPQSGYSGGSISTATTSSLPILPPLMSSLSLLSSSSPSPPLTEMRNNRINKMDKASSSSSPSSGSILSSNKKWIPPSIVSSQEIVTANTNQSPESRDEHQNGAWLETRARRIMGNVIKSQERSRQLLLCEEAGGGELCRMLFKGHLNE